MGLSTLQKLTAICAISTTVPTASALVAAVDAAQAFGLLGRDTCTSNGLTSCGSSLPSGWCCPASTSCLSLNNTGTASALCCPQGNDCSLIETISCNITLQDASKFPQASLHTQDLSITLPSCGNNCCPLGYECNSSGICQMLNSTKEAPTPSVSSSSTTTSPTSSSISLANKPTGTSSPANASPTPIPGSDFSGRDFAAGFVPGLVIGILGTAALIFFLLRRHRDDEKDSIFNEKPDRQISDPIYNPQFTARTDFLHKRAASAPSTTAVATTPETALGGLYNPSPASSSLVLTTPTPAPKRTRTKFNNRIGETPSTPPLRVRALFTSTKSPSLRRKKSTRSLARKASDKSSEVSEATIDVRMSQGTSALGRDGGLYPLAVTRVTAAAPVPAGGSVDDSRRGTTFSDVLRAVAGEGSPAPLAGAGNGERRLGSPWRGK